MKVNAIDHVNIIVEDLDATATFYAEVLGLDRRNGPPPLPPTQVQWMYDDAGRPVVHINSLDCPRAYDRDVSAGPTGAIHHIALNCSGFEEMKARLDARGIDYAINDIPSIGLSQIFLRDPNDVVLELNFYGRTGS
ncbi:MAG: VOC family protein [Sphingomonadales bacterium]|nr:VOC family protein [Sphingomonadales bacterium]